VSLDLLAERTPAPPAPPINMAGQMGNLNAILKWTIEHGHKEDAPANHPSYAKEMSEERKEWLKKAIEEMSKYEDVMNIVAQRLQGLDEDGVTPLPMTEAELIVAQETTLEEMLCVIDNIDFARDFGQIGGADALLSLLASPHAGLRWRSAEVVATVVQNNPDCQLMMLERNVLETLMDMVESDEDVTVRTKAFLAISSQIRGHQESLERFLKKGGVNIMIQLLENEDGERALPLIKKVLFLIPGIVFMRPSFATVGKESGLLDQCLTYCTWGVVVDEDDTNTMTESKESQESQEERATKFAQLRESALKATLKLSLGTGGVEKECKRRFITRSVKLSQLEGDEKVYAEEEIRLLGEVAQAK
jgi:hypothetical protein